jgi:hypothetical protein
VLHRRSPVEVTERTPASHKLELADDEQIHVRRLDTAENQDKIRWHYLSSNPNQVVAAAENPDKINWDRLSSNPCGRRVKLLKENQNLGRALGNASEKR